MVFFIDWKYFFRELIISPKIFCQMLFYTHLHNVHQTDPFFVGFGPSSDRIGLPINIYFNVYCINIKICNS